MFEELRAIVAENLGVEESELTMETSFREDLEADSLDLFEMVMAVEEKYDVESPSEELENLNTITDVIKYIEAHK